MSWDEYDYSKININNNGSKHVKLVYCAYTQVIIIIMIIIIIRWYTVFRF